MLAFVVVCEASINVVCILFVSRDLSRESSHVTVSHESCDLTVSCLARGMPDSLVVDRLSYTQSRDPSYSSRDSSYKSRDSSEISRDF